MNTYDYQIQHVPSQHARDIDGQRAEILQENSIHAPDELTARVLIVPNEKVQAAPAECLEVSIRDRFRG